MERNGKPQLGHESVSDMDLLFGPAQVSDVDRGAPELADQTHIFLDSNSSASFGKNRESEEPKLQRDFDFSPIPQLDDLTFAIRYVLFDKSMQQGVFDHIVDFVQKYQEEQPNYCVLPEESKMMGYLFEDSQFAFYSLQLFRHADTLGLSCDLYDGFAPTLNPFWNALKSDLIDAQLVSQEDETFEDEEDDDLDFLDSDTEDGGLDGFMLDLSIPSMKYLNLEDDQTVIESWVQDIQDPNFSQETLLSLSYNCQSETNLQILVDNYAQDLFDSILASMSSSMTAETLPSVRSACVVLAELAKFSAVNVTEDHIKVLIDQLAKWTLSPQKTTDLMRSQEVATLLSKCILPKFSELAKGFLADIQTSVLETIQKETEFDEVKHYVESYRQLYAQPVR